MTSNIARNISKIKALIILTYLITLPLSGMKYVFLQHIALSNLNAISQMGHAFKLHPDKDFLSGKVILRLLKL